MNVKEFKIRILRGLMRPEYFYLPVKTPSERIEYKFYIDVVDPTSGKYLTGASIHIDEQAGISLMTAEINGVSWDNPPGYTGSIKPGRTFIRDEPANKECSVHFWSTGQRIEISGVSPGFHYGDDNMYWMQNDLFLRSDYSPALDTGADKQYNFAGYGAPNHFYMLNDGTCNSDSQGHGYAIPGNVIPVYYT